MRCLAVAMVFIVGCGTDAAGERPGIDAGTGGSGGLIGTKTGTGGAGGQIATGGTKATGGSQMAGAPGTGGQSQGGSGGGATAGATGTGGTSGASGTTGGAAGAAQLVVPPTCYQSYAANVLKVCNGGTYSPAPGCASKTELLNPIDDGGMQACVGDGVCAILAQSAIPTASCWVPDQPSGFSQPCNTGSDCMPHSIPLLCVGNLCKKDLGDSCSSDPTDCASGFCDGNRGCSPAPG